MKLLRFYADWCAPCKRVAPLVDAMASRYALAVEAVNVDRDSAADPVERYGVHSVPTFVIVDDTGEPVYTGSGVECIPTLQTALETL